MKSFRNAISALVLAFVFSTAAFAGDGVMHTDKTPPPPPPPAQADGVMHTDLTAPTPEADVVTDIALYVLQNLLTLL
jgi:hypothetical protein